jgi:thiamine biosynthesis protein ThiI
VHDAATATPPPAAPEESTLLLRFGELTLKSEGVRKRFTRILRGNIENAFQREGLDCLIRDDFGHLYVDTNDMERAMDVLSRIFGLTSVSPAALLPSRSLQELAEAAARYALATVPPAAKTFAVRARRTGSHPYSSQDVARACGGAIQTLAASRGTPLKVNLDAPEFEVEVEVRENRAYLYARRIPCAGGLPVGTAGKIVFVLRRDSALADLDARAAWMLMKRGAFPLYLVAGDEGARAPADGPSAALKRLARWGPTHKLWVAADPLDKAAIEGFAARNNASAVAFGARASSGKLDAAVTLAGGLPTFHPLLALTNEEVAKIPLD